MLRLPLLAGLTRGARPSPAAAASRARVMPRSLPWGPFAPSWRVALPLGGVGLLRALAAAAFALGWLAGVLALGRELAGWWADLADLAGSQSGPAAGAELTRWLAP